MKILSQKIYNNDTKDTEYFIQFNNKELRDYIKEAGFIREEYICMTSFKSYNPKRNMSGVVAIGMKDNKKLKVCFDLEYTLNSNNVGCYKIYAYNFENDSEQKIYEFDGNTNLFTMQKQFLLQLIKDKLLKY